MAIERHPVTRVVEPAVTKTYETDGTGSAGDAVTLNGSGQVTPTSASGDYIFGILADNPDGDGEVAVHRQGIIYGNVAGSASAGDALAGSGTAGQLAAAGTAPDGTAGYRAQAEMHDGELVVFLS